MTSENTARLMIGFRSDQAIPRTEDLYLTFVSLRTRFARSWREAHSSRIRGTM